MKNVVIVAALVAAFAANPLAAKKAPTISGLELQQIQSRDFEVGKDVVFPSVMSVLQDAGYRIQAADRDTGLITGIGSSKGNLTWAPFVGFGTSKKTPVVSAYIEDRGRNMARVRLNFVMTKKAGNMYGASTEGEDPVTDQIVYQEAFEKISKAVFVRLAMDAPPAALEPAAPALSGSAAPSMSVAGAVTAVSQSVPPK